MFLRYNSTRPYDNQMDYPEYLLERFWDKVDIVYNKDETLNMNACMIWKGALLENGYGVFYNLKKNIRAHRFIYECYNGPIPEYDEYHKRMCICHKCNNRSCVNPLHLKIGTNQQNSDDMVNAGRQARGSTHGNSIFEDTDIIDILTDIYNNKYFNVDEISKKYSVDRRTICGILKGKNWTHITKKVCKDLNCNLLKLEKKVLKPTKKLSVNQVQEIKKRLKKGDTNINISREFKIHNSTVSKIKNNWTWLGINLKDEDIV